MKFNSFEFGVVLLAVLCGCLSVYSGILYGKLNFNGLVKIGGRPSLTKFNQALASESDTIKVAQIRYAKKVYMGYVICFGIFLIGLVMLFIYR